MYKVSFVATVYNKSIFLPHVINALAVQHGNFEREFIFVNDGSSDDSLTVLGRLTSDWPNVLIFDQENQGPSAALNAGLNQATGDFIKPLDGDDVLTPWATQRLMDAILTTGCQVAYGAQQHSYDVTVPPQRLPSERHAREGKIQLHDAMLRRSLRRAQTNPTAWLARADLVRRIGGCDPRVFIQDYSIELRLANETEFAHVEEPIFLSPSTMEGRLSENEAQILHDINLALTYFLSDFGDIPPELRRYAFARAAGRSWLWARRHRRRALLSAEFLRYVGARMNVVDPSFENCRRTCEVFVKTNKIRLMPNPINPRRYPPSHVPANGRLDG